MFIRFFSVLSFFICVWIAFAQPPLSSHTFVMNGRLVTYELHGHYAVVQGDIIVGASEQIESLRSSVERGERVVTPDSFELVFGTSGPSLWPDGTIYYTIDADVPNQDRILNAITEWNTKTPLKVLPRAGQPNYVRFQIVKIDAGCDSAVGMQGGEQPIGLTDGCPTGSVVHEIGHAFGLLHEQGRSDRDANLTILYENIDKRFADQDNQSLTGVADAGYYDFGSIMHYGPKGFTRNGGDTIETVPVGIPIGQRDGLSAGDIDGVSRLYGKVPTTTTVTTTPAGLMMQIDGALLPSPQTFSWNAGSAHSIGVIGLQGNDPRYQFANWSDKGDVTHSIKASSDHTVFCANFVAQHPVTAGVSGGNGSVSLFPASADRYYAERFPLLLTATTAGSDQFSHWTGHTFLSLTRESLSASPALIETAMVGSDYEAVFTSAPQTTVDSQPRGITVTVDSFPYLTPVNFVWSAGSTHSLSVTTPQLTGNNTTRYQFTSWDDGSTGTRTITVAPKAVTYTAKCTAQYLLTLVPNGPGKIAITPSATDNFYDAGSTVQVSAQPTSGSTLRYWLGDLAGGSANQTLTMSEQRAAVALFGPALAFRVLSAGSLQGNPIFGDGGSVVSPGEIVSVFGANIGPSTAASGTVANGAFTTSVNGTSVLFDGVPAPIIYAGPNQINAIVPLSVAGKKTTNVSLKGNSAPSSVSNISVAQTVPSLFTADASGAGQIAGLNQDLSLNGPGNPAAAGSVIVLYATGSGLTDQSSSDGQITGGTLLHPVTPVYVRVGKLPATVLYAGSAPGLVNGVLQVNVQLPAELIPGDAIPIRLIVGGLSSPPGTTIAVR